MTHIYHYVANWVEHDSVYTTSGILRIDGPISSVEKYIAAKERVNPTYADVMHFLNLSLLHTLDE